MLTDRGSSSRDVNYEKDTCIDIVLPDVSGANKIQLLHSLAREGARFLPVSEDVLYDFLSDQESRASSGVGQGVAIPTLKLKELTETVVFFSKLSHPVDFNAVDGEAVDLVCLLCSPRDEGPYYLRRLSRLSRLFRNRELCDKIRSTTDIQAIKELVHNPEGWTLVA